MILIVFDMVSFYLFMSLGTTFCWCNIFNICFFHSSFSFSYGCFAREVFVFFSFLSILFFFCSYLLLELSKFSFAIMPSYIFIANYQMSITAQKMKFFI